MILKVLIFAVNREKFPDPVFPTGASYIAESVKKAGYETVIFDACFSEDVYKDLRETLIKEKPEVVGFSIRNVDNISFPIAENYLPYYKDCMKIARENSNATVVVGGSGFSIFPELYMEELKADFGIKGEGEFLFIELLRDIEKNNLPKEKLLYSPQIKDINFDDFPKRSGFDVDNYYKYSGCINIQTKRGCAFKCSYCTYPLLEGNSYRFRTAEKVVDEIEFWVNEKGIKHFFFVDNVFNHPENYSKSICLEIIKRNLKINWTGFFIPKIVDKEYLSVCKESGITSIDFGTDAFSETTLKGYDKFFTKDDIFESCRMSKEVGIKFNHSIIFGGPNETKETMDETIKNIDLTNPTSVIGFIGVRLYPHTPIARRLKDIEIGINPVFYVSEEVKEFIVEYLREKLSGRQSWIVPGLEKGTNEALFKKMRERGKKGPLWEFFG